MLIFHSPLALYSKPQADANESMSCISIDRIISMFREENAPETGA
jgi:hypothetical protein